MGHKQFLKFASIGIQVLLLMSVAARAFAEQQPEDSVYGMCLDAGRTPEICSCAAVALMDELGDENYATYDRVGAAYLHEMMNGLGRSDAWMSAIEAEGLALEISNGFGRSHRAAMISCES